MCYLIMHNPPKIVMHYAICDFHRAPTWEKPKSDALLELCNSRSCIMRTSTVCPEDVQQWWRPRVDILSTNL